MDRLVISCGTAVYKDRHLLLVVHVGGNGLAVARFVAALVALLASTAGVVIGATASITGGGIVLAVGIAAVLLFRQLGKVRARKASRAPMELPRYVTIDCAAQEVRDHQGELLGPLAAARLEMVFQVTSSSKALALTLPGTKIVIARGSPFAGDVDRVADVLVQHGVRAA
jgi:hypothetical protein